MCHRLSITAAPLLLPNPLRPVISFPDRFVAMDVITLGYAVPMIVFNGPARAAINARFGFTALTAPPGVRSANFTQARAETISSKPAWTTHLTYRRGLVAVHAVTERDDACNLYRYESADGSALLLPTLYRRANGVTEFVLISTDTPEAFAARHPRIPVALDADAALTWLDLRNPPHVVQALLSAARPIYRDASAASAVPNAA